ncbi:MAG: swr complex subunit [Stictis urceolatum]|nr:swr complex subunit [Stictis urceolata]
MPDELKKDVVDDEDYNSAEDEDFAPEDDNASSESESEKEDGATTKPGKIKRQKLETPGKDAEPAIDQDEVEGLMQDAGRRKKRRKDGAEDADDSGGEGGFVKTRSMAALQQEEKKKTLASDAEATIDVDALWKSMNDASFRQPRKVLPPMDSSPSKLLTALAPPVDASEAADDLITITQTYTFAGQTHTTTTQVPRHSSQVQAHLENPSLTQAVEQKLGPNGKPLVRPLRRISPFDPNPTGFVKGLPDPNDPIKKPGNTKNKNKGPKHKYAIPKVKQPAKLNVVDKSKLDWAAHVNASGARDELEAAKKAKGNYLEQRDFLDRVGGREDDARAAAKV